MENSRSNLFTRDDTFLGVCEGLGQDLGISPTLLRLAFIPALFFYPMATIAGYLGLAILVLASRLIFPAPRAAVAAPVEAETEAAPVEAEPLPIAA
jgi:phage shock protein C